MKVDRRVRRTKKALETAFLELMHEGSYQRITILAICEKADYTRGAFYKHYNSKEDLLHQITENRIGSLLKALKEPYATTKQLEISLIHPAALKLFDHIYLNRDFYQLIKHPDFKLVLQERMVKMFIHHFLNDLNFEYADHSRRIEEKIKAYHLAYATFGVVLYWIEQDFRFSSHYMAKELMWITTTPMFRATFSPGEFQGEPTFYN
ncbi:MAG TPA: TetR/AcrR family transcriptional regulator [Planococcus sp. (in: firmicutes)]|nr:TetR/AcrR family transcriptional regulator [Planococcus sp. (in: firmicutes)]